MSKKSKKNRIGVVFSTNPEYNYQHEELQGYQSTPPAEQRLRVSRDRKNRRGKDVTLITGFQGRGDELKVLAKMLKSKCGVGGAVKEGEILIQGNNVDKVVSILIQAGYTQTKRSGG
jgi:translation initiation factor 1